jgi:excisionase family DNA binding protein
MNVSGIRPPPVQLADLPMLATPKQAAQVMGITESQARGLVRVKRIGHIVVGKRIMIPRNAIEPFIADNTVPPCRVEIPGPAYGSSKSGTATTLSGLKAVAAGSAARALQIANKLKSRSQSSSTCEPGTPDRVIPLRSS